MKRAREELAIARGEMTRIDQQIGRWREMGIDEGQLAELREQLEALEEERGRGPQSSGGQSQFAGAAQRGSAEAFRIIAQSSRNSPQVKEQQKGNKILKNIEKNTKLSNPQQAIAVQGAI